MLDRAHNERPRPPAESGARREPTPRLPCAARRTLFESATQGLSCTDEHVQTRVRDEPSCRQRAPGTARSTRPMSNAGCSRTVEGLSVAQRRGCSPERRDLRYQRRGRCGAARGFRAPLGPGLGAAPHRSDVTGPRPQRGPAACCWRAWHAELGTFVKCRPGPGICQDQDCKFLLQYERIHS